VRPILLSREDGAALISPASGKVRFSLVYPQSVSAQPLVADLNRDGTDDLLVVSSDALWGYRVVVDTGGSGGFVIVMVTLLIGSQLRLEFIKPVTRQDKPQEGAPMPEYIEAEKNRAFHDSTEVD